MTPHGRKTTTIHALGRQRCVLPAELDAQVQAAVAAWEAQRGTARLWARDASLWSGDGEDRWLGWLDIAGAQLARAGELRALAAGVCEAGFTAAVVLGMGGSSLCPAVLAATFGPQPGFPELGVLDSTDPAQVRALERRLDLARTLFIVASKSGTTLEPDIFMRYFLERLRAVAGAEAAGRHFMAITDPGSQLERFAAEAGFRGVCHGVPAIGGRYSALSDFGLVPAAVMGVDAGALLERAAAMAGACRAGGPAAENPGVALGLLLGTAARGGRDKLTFVISPAIAALGTWLEQLVAESTGKQGKALIPVAGETPAAPGIYGDDRLFVYLRLESAPDAAQDAAVERLEQAGQPVVRIAVLETLDLGQEFFRWEIATAVAGSLLGINPFDQPDVEASKVAARELTAAYEAAGALPEEQPLLEAQGLRLFADPHNAPALATAVAAAGGERSLGAYLAAHLARLEDGDYLALLAYVAMHPAHQRELEATRHAVRDAKGVATCLGFGPRFLHSTGQAYKGGPASGVFLQVTCDDAADLPVPGRSYSFGVVKAAQARGDFQVLGERRRRALRVHLGADVAGGLRCLRERVEQAVRG